MYAAELICSTGVLGFQTFKLTRFFLSQGHFKLHIIKESNIQKMNEGVVSKETVVLRRWGSSIQKFGFINGVDNVNWPPYRDSKS